MLHNSPLLSIPPEAVTLHFDCPNLWLMAGIRPSKQNPQEAGLEKACTMFIGNLKEDNEGNLPINRHE